MIDDGAWYASASVMALMVWASLAPMAICATYTVAVCHRDFGERLLLHLPCRRRRTAQPGRCWKPWKPGRRCWSTPQCRTRRCSHLRPTRARGPNRRNRCRTPNRRRRRVRWISSTGRPCSRGFPWASLAASPSPQAMAKLLDEHIGGFASGMLVSCEASSHAWAASATSVSTPVAMSFSASGASMLFTAS